MRYFLLIITIIFCSHFVSNAQMLDADVKIKKKVLKKHHKNEKEWCEEGINLAIEDYSKGIRKIFEWGDGVEDKVYDAAKKILTSEYGFIFEHLGCTPDLDAQCYTDFMYRKIELENGKDFFKKIIERAKRITE